MSGGDAAGGRPHISVIAPVYCCEACLSPLYERVRDALAPITGDFELLLVNDKSPGDDWRAIAELAARDPRVRGIDLARNFGQHHAIMAGIEASRGEYVAVMDCDLQDRPEELPKLYAKIREGYHAVFARRIDRRDAVVKKASSKLFHAVSGVLRGEKSDATVANFSIISRRVAQNLLRFREANRNYCLHVHWLGFKTAYVDVAHSARHAGETSYTWRKQIVHAVTTILAQSTRPLYASATFGLFMSTVAAGFGTYFVIRKLVFDVPVSGWTSLMVSLFFLSGMLFVNLGIVGLYIGSIIQDVRGRPLYVVERTTYDEDHET